MICLSTNLYRPILRHLTAALILLAAVARAQSASVVPFTDWSRLLQLPVNTHLKISAIHHGGDCLLQSVTTDTLVCAHGNSTRSLSKADIKQVKLARRGRSTALGAALGAGIGAGAGAGVGSAINAGNSSSILHTTGGKSAGVGAAIGIILGTATGAAVGYTTDLFASPVLYKR